MRRLTQIRTAKKNGILNPFLAYRAAKNAGIPYWVLCSFLMQETGGGRNVYGHDVNSNGYPQPFYGHGEVTKENYIAYKKERDIGVNFSERFPNLGRRSQGVGPMQLTWWQFQDDADLAGGCWDKYVNMLTGAKILAGSYKVDKNWHNVAKRYNGSESYALSMDTWFLKWKKLLT